MASHQSNLLVGAALALGAILAACGSANSAANGGGGDGGADGRGARADGKAADGGGGRGSHDGTTFSLGGSRGDAGHGGHSSSAGHGSHSSGDGGHHHDATTDGGSGSGAHDDAGRVVDADFPCDGCGGFPEARAPACAATTLSPPALVYPPDGVLLPPNMNVLEVQWLPPALGAAALYEVDFSNGVTDVRVETPCNEITSVRGIANVGCGLTLSQAAWNDIAHTNAGGDPVNVTVRAAPAAGGCATSSPEAVRINFAQQNLGGGIYYWQSATYGGVAGTTGGIYYHDFGTFDPAPTPFWTSGATGTCIGCHTLSKDGVVMSVMHDDPDADDEFGDVHTNSLVVATRSVVGADNVSPGFQTFTHDHKYMVASTFKGVMGGMGMGGMGGMGTDESFAVWTSDGNTLVKVNALPTGMQGTQPNLSQDDKTVVFVSPTFGTISMAGDHHFMGGSLWQASFDESTGAMGSYSPFLTSTGMQNFYYPDQSSDGNWVLFNENDDTSTANNEGDCFYSRQAVVKILHFPSQAGDAPLALPNLNLGAGLTNSWPRWSPVAQTYKGHQILWVTFSSNRDYGLRLLNTGFDNYYPPESPQYDQPQPMSKQGVTFDDYAAPQIWMAAIVIDPDRSLDASDRSFPAFWLPFQDVTAHNHSAQWVATFAGSTGDGGVSDAGGLDSGGSGVGDARALDSGGVEDTGVTDTGVTDTGVTDTGTGTADTGPTCGEEGAGCGTPGACCSDVICCSGSCAVVCNPK